MFGAPAFPGACPAISGTREQLARSATANLARLISPLLITSLMGHARCGGTLRRLDGSRACRPGSGGQRINCAAHRDDFLLLGDDDLLCQPPESFVRAIAKQ